MSAGTVVIAGGVLATVILLTIVAVLCLCRLQYYCCKRGESEKGEDGEPELDTMSPSRPLALSAPPYASHAAACQRSHAFCPSCARCSLPFYLQHPERLCNGGRRISYRTVQQQDLELPMDLESLYQKLNLIRSVTMKEVVSQSVSTDV
uniref:Family with sequence similarity 163 member B n=1 Tax=Gasterosteus aculeatus aculeatus TaxID=481459 RepID=A0AAQ4RBH6_GASAC